MTWFVEAIISIGEWELNSSSFLGLHLKGVYDGPVIV